MSIIYMIIGGGLNRGGLNREGVQKFFLLKRGDYLRGVLNRENAVKCREMGASRYHAGIAYQPIL